MVDTEITKNNKICSVCYGMTAVHEKQFSKQPVLKTSFAMGWGGRNLKDETTDWQEQ